MRLQKQMCFMPWACSTDHLLTGVAPYRSFLVRSDIASNNAMPMNKKGRAMRVAEVYANIMTKATLSAPYAASLLSLVLGYFQ